MQHCFPKQHRMGKANSPPAPQYTSLPAARKLFLKKNWGKGETEWEIEHTEPNWLPKHPSCTLKTQESRGRLTLASFTATGCSTGCFASIFYCATMRVVTPLFKPSFFFVSPEHEASWWVSALKPSIAPANNPNKTHCSDVLHTGSFKFYAQAQWNFCV